jgi:hypothetical protein
MAFFFLNFGSCPFPLILYSPSTINFRLRKLQSNTLLKILCVPLLKGSPIARTRILILMEAVARQSKTIFTQPVEFAIQIQAGTSAVIPLPLSMVLSLTVTVIGPTDSFGARD